jgi:hypothetical protein
MRGSRLQAFLDSLIEAAPDRVRLLSPCRSAQLEWGIALLRGRRGNISCDFLVFDDEGCTSRGKDCSS